MSFVRRTSLDESYSERAARAPKQIDLDPGEWEEVNTSEPLKDGHEFCTIASFWIVAALLLAVLAAAPALHVAAHYLT